MLGVAAGSELGVTSSGDRDPGLREVRAFHMQERAAIKLINLN